MKSAVGFILLAAVTLLLISEGSCDCGKREVNDIESDRHRHGTCYEVDCPGGYVTDDSDAMVRCGGGCSSGAYCNKLFKVCCKEPPKCAGANGDCIPHFSPTCPDGTECKAWYSFTDSLRDGEVVKDVGACCPK